MQSTAPPPRRRFPTPRVSARRLFWPFILTSAVSSLAIHLRNSRQQLIDQQSAHSAQLSVLHSLVEKLQEGKAVSQEVQRREYERVGLLPRSEAADTVNTEKIGWREMLFGRQKSEADIKRESQETQDIEDSIRRFDGEEPASNSETIASLVRQTDNAKDAVFARPAAEASQRTQSLPSTASADRNTGLVII